MEHIQSGDLNNDFRTCLAQLLEHGYTAHPRGTTTKEFLNYNITLRDARNRIINFPDRKTNLKYLLGEFIWYLSGDPSPEPILPYSKFWGSLTNSGDFDEYEKGTVNSNYGTRLFGRSSISSFWEGRIQPINQWIETKELLTKDKATRQAIMNIHVPADRHDGNKDVPCTLTLHWFIREDKLCLIVNMRSNDIVLGFTNDVFQFTMLQEMMLVQLRSTYPELELGTYFHNAGSMHIYDRHFEMATKIVADERALELSMIPMDDLSQETIYTLIAIEADWRADGCRVDYDFDSNGAFARLSLYWQNLIKMCFNEDEEAMQHMFGLEHKHED